MKWNSPKRKWLQENGYMDGNAELLQTGQKLWKQNYHREYQRNRRQAKRERVITFSEVEDTEVQAKADEHHQAISAYVRESCLAYGRQIFVVPDEQMVIAIKEELALTRYAIEAIEQKVSVLLKEADNVPAQCEILSQHYPMLSDRIEHLFVFVVAKLEKPPLANQALTASQT